MSIETVARQTLYRQAHARGGDLHSLADRALLRRIWRFADRHHRRLSAFVAVSVVSATLAVATPVLAGRVVDARDNGEVALLHLRLQPIERLGLAVPAAAVPGLRTTGIALCIAALTFAATGQYSDGSSSIRASNWSNRPGRCPSSWASVKRIRSDGRFLLSTTTGMPLAVYPLKPSVFSSISR